MIILIIHHKPGISTNLRCTRSFRRILTQHFVDQAHGLKLYIRIWNDFSDHDAREELFLIFVFERMLPSQDHVSNNTQSPNISLKSRVSLLFHDLGGHVRRRPTINHQFGIFVTHDTESKIDNFSFTMISYQYIIHL